MNIYDSWYNDFIVKEMTWDDYYPSSNVPKTALGSLLTRSQDGIRTDANPTWYYVGIDTGDGQSTTTMEKIEAPTLRRVVKGYAELKIR